MRARPAATTRTFRQPQEYGLAVTLTAWQRPEPEHALPPWKRPHARAQRYYQETAG
jgi:hypothetical protein